MPTTRAPALCRVLLAEDNEINQLVAQGMLAPMVSVIDTAVNGRLAIEAHVARPYDLILMDVQMPELDGLDATRRIRALEAEGKLPRRPIIALTANAYSSDRAACLAAGMDDFVSKPFLQAALMAAVERWLPGTPPA